MVNYEEAVDWMNAVCVRKFEEFAERKTPVMIPRFVQFYAFDVLGEITVSLQNPKVGQDCSDQYRSTVASV